MEMIQNHSIDIVYLQTELSFTTFDKIFWCKWVSIDLKNLIENYKKNIYNFEDYFISDKTYTITQKWLNLK